jgi:Secretion system C-terminal sorting domain/Fibronectin type III domain
MNRILLVIGFLVCVFSSFAAEFPKNYRETALIQVDTTTPVACQTPQGLFASARDTMASLNWLSYGPNAGYAVQWKLKNDSLWKTAEVTQNTYLLRGIKTCSEYEFRVKTLCGLSGMSAYSESKKFKTSGCVAPCTTPREINADMADTKATFKWAASARAYEIQIQDASNTGSWTTQIVAGNAFTAPNLKPCTKYNFHVRSICSDATTATTVLYSEWSSIITVATTGCAAPCAAPRKIYYFSTATTAVIKWDTTRSATYELQIMGPRDSVWKTFSGITKPSYELTSLPNCAVYQARVRVICSNSTNPSPWSYTIRFKTIGCQEPCKAPSALKFYVADSVAVFSWVAPNASKFVFQYKTDADVNWKSLNLTSNIYVLTGLSRCKKYMARVQTVCNSTSSSDFSNELKFETNCQSPCARPVDLKSDIVSDTVAVLYWIGTGGGYEIQYRIATDVVENWKSVKVPNSAYKLPLEKCKTYYWRVRKLCDATVAFSDWSELGKFETKGCQQLSCVAPKNLKTDIGQDTLVYLSWVGQAGTFEVQYQVAGAGDWRSIKVLALEHKLVLPKCNGYYWRVRRICDNGFSDWSELGKFETKGCTVPQPCDMVPGLNVLLVSDTIVSANWLSSQNKYEIQYRIVGSTDWVSEKFERVYDAKLKLRPCRVYEIRIRGLCDDGSASNWSNITKIETKGCTPSLNCPAPAGLVVKNDAAAVAYLLWMDSSDRDSVFVQFRLNSDTAWTNISTLGTTPNGLILRGLEGCKEYKIRARRKCVNGLFSDWSEISYKRNVNCLDNNNVTTTSLSRKSTVAASAVYPNPGRDFIQVEYELTETTDVKVQMVNVQGQVVKQLDNSIQDAGNYMQVLDNLDNVQQGLYFIIIRTDGKISVSQKWIKQ